MIFHTIVVKFHFLREPFVRCSKHWSFVFEETPFYSIFFLFFLPPEIRTSLRLGKQSSKSHKSEYENLKNALPFPNLFFFFALFLFLSRRRRRGRLFRFSFRFFFHFTLGCLRFFLNMGKLFNEYLANEWKTWDRGWNRQLISKLTFFLSSSDSSSL